MLFVYFPVVDPGQGSLLSELKMML